MAGTVLNHTPDRSVRMSGAWPLLGHAPRLLRDPLAFLGSAYPLGELVSVKLGPKPAYLVNGPEQIRRVLVADAASYDKGFQFDQLRVLIGDGVGTSSGAKHRRQRRLMRPAFDHAHVEGYVETAARCAEEAVAGWRDGARIDAGEQMRALSMTVVAGTMFDSGGDHVARSPAVREILASLPVLLGGIGRRALLPIPLLEKAPTPGNRRFEQARASLHALADRMVAAHRGAGVGPGRPNLLSTLLAAVDDDGTGMSDAQAHDEIMTVLLAGTETTAGTLSWVLHVLARDQALQHEVQREVCEVVGAGRPRAKDLSALSLTRRVVSETLRLYPPGWIIGRRPVEDTELAGTTIPAGTQVLLNFYGLHRDPKAYQTPDRFDADRWLDPDPEVTRAYFRPFGLGPHDCIGEGFAWTQMLTALAVITTGYTVRPVPGSVVRPVARTTLHPGVLPLILEARR
jgi:cytochrome P450